jgi:hypothetical protein
MPTTEEIKRARKAAGLTQLEAIRVLRPGSKTARTWLKWERSGEIPSDSWELFLIKTKAARKKTQTREKGHEPH